jgi:hypothetical protein
MPQWFRCSIDESLLDGHCCFEDVVAGTLDLVIEPRRVKIDLITAPLEKFFVDDPFAASLGPVASTFSTKSAQYRSVRERPPVPIVGSNRTNSARIQSVET